MTIRLGTKLIANTVSSMPIGTIYQAIRTDIPVGSLRLDGTEYSNGFDSFVTSYLATGKVICKTYNEWQTEYTITGGNVGFFAYDSETGKFKTPCIQAGTFLAQAVLSGEFGSFLNSALKSHTHTQAAHTHTRGTMNITGSFQGSRSSSSENYKEPSGAFVRGSGGDSYNPGGSDMYNISFNASNSWTGSTSSAQPAISATGGSDTYPKHLRYPFFVVVSNVEAESPAQVNWDNFVGNLDSKANKSLNNLDEQGEKHFLNKQQITNCLLEVPQRIKYTLDDGTFTLLAGSVVIVPYGTEDLSTTYPVGSTFLNENFIVVDTQYADGKFFVWVELVNDISYNQETTGTQTRILSLSISRETEYPFAFNVYHNSGDTAPSTNQARQWYDTANNKCVHTEKTTGTISIATLSLPLGIITADGVNVFGTVDQVFNGFGYIGYTAWVDKDVKGLMPKGRNEDGMLKNIEYTTSKLQVFTSPSANTTYNIAISPDGTLHAQQVKNYYELEYPILPDVGTASSKAYVKSENMWYQSNSSTSYTWQKLEQFVCTQITWTDGTITSLNPKQPFRAAEASMCDGQWIEKFVTIANGVTSPTSDTLTYDLSDYLPNDGYTYEVAFSMIGTTDAKSSAYTYGILAPTGFAGNYIMYNSRVAVGSTNAVRGGGNAIIPIDTKREIGVRASGSNSGTFTLQAVAYRRLGINS